MVPARSNPAPDSWLPCPKSNWCANIRDRLATSIINDLQVTDTPCPSNMHARLVLTHRLLATVYSLIARAAHRRLYLCACEQRGLYFGEGKGGVIYDPTHVCLDGEQTRNLCILPFLLTPGV